ncbi:AraC family transcriptional regulator [Bacteroides caecigallinarum]|nr:AraC family transcriptional regulator [Bacteroides caecigallinarum]
MIYNIQTRSLRRGDCPIGTIIHFLPERISLCTIRRSNVSLQDISYELNFPDQSFFTRYFKKHTGITPLEYRLKY